MLIHDRSLFSTRALPTGLIMHTHGCRGLLLMDSPLLMERIVINHRGEGQREGQEKPFGSTHRLSLSRKSVRGWWFASARRVSKELKIGDFASRKPKKLHSCCTDMAQLRLSVSVVGGLEQTQKCLPGNFPSPSPKICWAVSASAHTSKGRQRFRRRVRTRIRHIWYQ